MLKYLLNISIIVLLNSVANGDESELPMNTIKPFLAKYIILRKSDELGEATRQLEIMEDGLAKYNYRTKAEWFMFSDRRDERSIIKLGHSGIIPTDYFYSRRGTGRDKKYQWTYDVANKKANNVKDKKLHNIDFPENIQDKLSYHLYLRTQLINNPHIKKIDFPVIGTNGKISSYVFEYDGEETLSLPMGNIKAIKFKREVIARKRVTYAWYAPELNFFMVKLTQYKKGDQQFDTQLKTLTIDDVDIRLDIKTD